jgi:hypothetical protein
MSDETKPDLSALITPGMVSAGVAPQLLVPMEIGGKAADATLRLEIPVTTLFIDGLVKRPAPAGPQTPVPWVEPVSDLPEDSRERLKAMDDYDLEKLVEWFAGSPHYTDLVAYARAVVIGRVPREARIACSRCDALYGAWTKRDDEWCDAQELVGGWQELEFRCGPPDDFEETAWRALCPACPPTAEESAEAQACREAHYGECEEAIRATDE